MGSPLRRLACVVTALALVGVAAAPARAADPPRPDGTWQRPVDGAVVRPFDPPASVYGAGHRGVDFAAEPGTAVRAANGGVVTFAGAVAGSLHVTVAHDGGLRTSYSFLQTITVREGDVVARGQVVGTTGGSDPDHDGRVLHFGVRVGGQYVDPMVLFRVDDLTELVHLVPVDGSRVEEPWTSADERRELVLSLHLPRPGAAATAAGATGAIAANGDEGCSDGIPVIGAVVDAACSVAEWVGDQAAAAVDAGVRVLDAATDLADTVLDGLRTSLRATADLLRMLPERVGAALARTPLGMLVLDVIEMGRRFVHAAFAECSDDAPDADGTGGSTHRVMVVAGINSSGLAGDRGATVGLDVDALGYHRAEGEVRYYSYASDGGPYDAHDTHRPIRGAAARLAEQLRAMQREQPGREVDLIAHSQGGVVVDRFLQRFYDAADPTLPPLGTVITLSSPHEGAPLATAASQVRSSRLGKEATDAIARLAPGTPPASAPSVRDMSESSALIADVRRRGVPEHIDYTSIGVTEDLVVPATNISLRGATETTVAVNSPSEHSAIVDDPNALRAVRAALEGRPPPCVGLDTALRGAIAPVLISRASHLFGDLAGGTVGRLP